MGPILPQLTVFGKQLGIAPDIMGLITSVLPLLYILAKPAVGFLIDYFSVGDWRSRISSSLLYSDYYFEAEDILCLPSRACAKPFL